MSQLWDYLQGHWFYSTAEVIPESSAVLNNNYALFYGIHGVSISLQIISLTSCSFVVLFIALSRMKQHTWDFSDRFPLCLALLDIIWGTSNLVDGSLMVTRKTYPSSATCTALGIYLWVFFGYQQMMNVGLVVYMYLKVVLQKQVFLGCGEWKLHAVCTIMSALCVAVFYPLESFGCTGFWFLHKSNTTSGIVLGYYMCISTSVQAVCTAVGYRSIIREIEAQKKLLATRGIRKVGGDFRHHSVATECLTTFVRIAEILYCTLAIAAWAFLIQVTFGVQEPTTILLMLATANSSGWANAIGYFYNRRVKARKAHKPHEHLPSVSAFPSSN